MYLYKGSHGGTGRGIKCGRGLEVVVVVVVVLCDNADNGDIKMVTTVILMVMV